MAAWAAVIGVLALVALAVAGAWRWAERVSDQVAAMPTREVSHPPLPPPPPEPDGEGRMIRNPSWAARPGGEFPAEAARAGVTQGSVKMRCEALAEGSIGACTIMEESPEGYGFGEAALAGARRGRLYPRLVDGVPTDSDITFTTRFRIE